MIFNILNGNVMQYLKLVNQDGTTITYNWVGDSALPILQADSDKSPLLKWGAICKYSKNGVISSDAKELYAKSESLNNRQSAFYDMMQNYRGTYDTRGSIDTAILLLSIYNYKEVSGFANGKNNTNRFFYSMNKERTIHTGISQIVSTGLTQELRTPAVDSGNLYNLYLKDGKYDINVASVGSLCKIGRNGQEFRGWYNDFSNKENYPIMYQYYQKIQNAFATNKTQSDSLYAKLNDYRIFSAIGAFTQNIDTDGRTAFISNDYDGCVATKEIVELYNRLINSTSEAEINKAKNEIDKCYVTVWLAKCFENGKIVDDNINYDDRIDFYARVDETNTINIEWVNKAVDNEQIEITENSYIEILCYKTVDDIMLNNPYSYKVPYSFGNFQLNIEDLKNTLNISPLAKYPIKITLQGYFDYGNNSLIGRNILFFEVDISEKNSFVSDYGEYSSSETYSDTINIGEPPTDDEPTYPTDDPTDDDPIDGGDVTTKNGLTTTYALTSANADSLGAFIWSNSNNWFDSLLKVQADALSNIVSCKLLPFSLNGTGKVIKIGNINTQVTALEIDNQVIRKSGGNLKLNRYFNNFLDYAPYTKISIYLPFIGFSQIENEYMYDGVEIEYLFDIITGEMLVLLKSNGKTFRTINGSFGIDIPFSSTNKAQIEGSCLSKIAKDVIDVNPIGLLDTYTDIATSRFKTSNSSSPSSVCAYSAPLQSFVTVDRPILNKPSSYNHDVGQKCVGSYYLRNLKGYTEVENIELNCPCTDSEKNEILSLLRSGVYL